VLRSAALVNRHVLVVFTTGELRPGVIQVALRPARGASGGFLAANLALTEAVTAQPAARVVRWRTRQALPFRRYYVQVSAIGTDGVTGCKPSQRRCHVHWSKVRVVSAHGG
jgi:hypothetical protein